MKSSSTVEAPPALIPLYEKRNAQSVECVKAAIALLQRREQKVTLAAIVKAATELESLNGAGCTISHTTILRNPGCRALYEAAASHRCSPRPLKRRKLNMTDSEKSRANRLSRCTKTELIALLIEQERDIRLQAITNAKLRDQMLSLQLKHQ